LFLPTIDKLLACYTNNSMTVAKRKGVKKMETVPFQLRMRKDLVIAWKVQAAKEERTASEIGEELISEYLKKKGGKSQ
jgi:hypothetical protein